MKNNLYFSHIPKTAGRTIESIMYDLGQEYVVGEGYFRSVIKKKHKYYYDYFLKKKYLDILINYNKNHWNIVFWHIPMSFWKDKILLEYKKNFTIFMIIRNPYDRIVSDFKYWIKFYYQQIDSKLKKRYSSLLNQIKEIYENNFELNANNMNKVIKKLLTNKKYYYSLDGHIIPQYRYLYTVINNVLIKIPDQVIRFENLENNFIKFKKQYQPLIPNNAIKNTHLNPSQSEMNIFSLSEDVKNLIFDYYHVDFRILGYKKM
tara:strand:+ start:222 stop:1004 length:783 start_codon:yes stop_codon:yes gene_type:complete